MNGSNTMKPHRVLFVCLGNICRSPTAEGVFRHQVSALGLERYIEIDSAGTGAWHVGNPPDIRAQQTARQRGIDLSSLRARQVTKNDFEYFDTIIAMDRNNQTDLCRLADSQYHEKIHLFLQFAPGISEDEVPDPYYGHGDGFSRVFDMIEVAGDGLISYIEQRRPAPL